MGLFGNFSESYSYMTNAIEQLIYHPYQDENIFKGLAVGGVIFVKQSIAAITMPVLSVFESIGQIVTFIFTYGQSE